MNYFNCKYCAIKLQLKKDFEKTIKYIKKSNMNGLGFKSVQEYVVVFSKKNKQKNIRFKHSMKSLQKKLKLSQTPTRIYPKKRTNNVLLDVVLKHKDEIIKKSNFISIGDWSLEHCLLSIIKSKEKSKNDIKLHNDIIAKEGALGAVKRNLMDYHSALRQENAWKQIKQESQQCNFVKKDVPYGTDIVVEFAPYGRYPATEEGKIQADKFKRIVKIKSYLGEGNGLTHRKKHYMIYSSESGWGKSTFVNYMLQNHNADTYKEKDNFYNVRENIQFLIIDEYSGQFSDDGLKLITSGNASNFNGKRKSYGSGWIPRPDLQLILLANKCSFKFHGVYNSKLQQKVLDFSLKDTFSQRFTCIKLDSSPIHDEQIDFIMQCMPSTLTDEERIKYLAYQYHEHCIVAQKQRKLAAEYCCDNNISMLNEFELQAKELAFLDMIRFIKFIKTKFPSYHDIMIKMHIYKLSSFINEKHEELNLPIISIYDLNQFDLIIEQLQSNVKKERTLK